MRGAAGGGLSSLGLAAGLGVLIRPQVLFFLGPPALALLVLCLWRLARCPG